MVFVEKKVCNDITAKIELDENTEFVAYCQACGGEVDISEEIGGDLWGFLSGSTRAYCPKCSARRNAEND